MARNRVATLDWRSRVTQTRMPAVAALVEIVFDCDDAPRLGQFWVEVLDGYSVRSYDDAEIQRLAALGSTPATDPVVMLDGPGPKWCFQHVEESKRTKNRVHLDIDAADRLAEVARLLHLGAAVLAEFHTWTTMADPEGNEFCVTDR